jgi:glycerol-3-phosphate dehydrogenase subunit B
MSKHDVVVVGIGLAGLTAAARLAQEGVRVLVLAKGVGATHHSGATIDILGYAPGRVTSPREALGTVANGHPYAAVGADGVAAALEWFKAQMASGSLAPYGYAGGLDSNLLLPTAVGASKPTAAAPVTMTRGDLREDGALCIVGFRGLKDFHAALLADNLARAGHRTRSVDLDLVPEGRADVNPLGYARAFDDPAFRAQVAAQLVSRPSAGERLGFPAMLGIANPHAVWADLEHCCGRPVFEVPTLPPSVPGMRVFQTLRDAIRRAGGKVILNAVVTGARAAGGRVEALRARVGLRETEFGAGWVVLATGGFAHGGLELSSRWAARETALGLPVAGMPEPGEARFRPEYLAEQPIARAGVATDHELRPVDAAGDRVFENVLVAGATLAGAEPWREKSGDGISLATGHRAAGLILGTAQIPSPPIRAGVEA